MAPVGATPMRFFILPLLVCGLWAQDAKPAIDTDPKATITIPANVESLKARIAWLQQKLAITEAKLAALAQFYAAQEQLQGLAAKEPKAETKQ